MENLTYEILKQTHVRLASKHQLVEIDINYKTMSSLSIATIVKTCVKGQSDIKLKKLELQLKIQ